MWLTDKTDLGKEIWAAKQENWVKLTLLTTVRENTDFGKTDLKTTQLKTSYKDDSMGRIPKKILFTPPRYKMVCGKMYMRASNGYHEQLSRINPMEKNILSLHGESQT